MTGVTEISVPVIILGGGGHSKVVIEGLRRLDVDIIGIADRSFSGSVPFGLQLIGDDDAVFEYDADAVLLVNGIGSLPNSTLRREIWRKFEARHYQFAGVVHPNAVISEDVFWNDGVQVMAGAVLQSGTCIGAQTIINTGARVDHDCIIGSDVHIAPGAILSGGVKIGDGAHVGAGATIIQAVTIGSEAVVAAGAVVVNDVAPGVCVASTPARPMQ